MISNITTGLSTGSGSSGMYVHTGPRQQLEFESTIIVSVITILFRGWPTASPELS